MEKCEVEDSVRVEQCKESQYVFGDIIVDCMLIGNKKSITIRIDEYEFKLSWSAIYDHNFAIELSKYSEEKKKYILQRGFIYNKDDEICHCTYSEIRGGNEKLYIDLGNYNKKYDMAINLLYQFDCIIKKISPDMNIEKIIGGRALKESGLDILFKALNSEKEAIPQRAQERFGKR